ncbi:hypothetical protein EG830_08350 [bacterium]|nr:hypothetical protein [bacterium]
MRKSNLFLKTLLLALLPAILITEVSAQDEPMGPGQAPVLPVPGYVIYSNGDTVWGKLTWALKYVENNPVEIKFTPEGGTKQTLTAADIAGFGNQLTAWIGEDDMAARIPLPPEDYVSLPSWKKKEPVFMNRLITGRVTVYLNRSSIGTSTSRIETRSRINGIGFTWIPGEGLSIGPTYRTDYRIIEGRSRYSSYFVVKDGGEMIKVEKETYDPVLEQLFGDCPAMQEEFVRNPDLKKFKNFMILAEVYNRLCSE